MFSNYRFFYFTFFPTLILLSSFLASLFTTFSGITFLIVNFWVIGFKTFEASNCCFSFFFYCFCLLLKTFPKGEYAILPCSIILLSSDGNISSPVNYPYLKFFQMIKLIFLLLLFEFRIVVFRL